MQNGVLSTADAGPRLCLGINATTAAFGGQGKALITTSCDAPTPPMRWALNVERGSLKGGPLRAATAVSCFPSRSLCNAFAASGAGSKDTNGLYHRSDQTSDGVPVFEKDRTHQLYRYGGDWRLGQMGVASAMAYRAAKVDGSGPPPAPQWSIVNGASPAPQAVICELPGAAQNCSCAQPVPAAASHNSASGKSFFPTTPVELVSCNSTETHMDWSSLGINGETTKFMLMTGGLCLTAPPPLVADRRPLVRPTEAAAPGPAPNVSAVRVVVHATHGDTRAILNEIRLYTASGRSPFPKRG